MRTSRRSATWFAAISVVTALVLTACAGSNEPTNGGEEGAERGGTLRIASPSAPVSSNPVMTGTAIPDEFFNEPAYDPLIFHAPDGSYEPRLATEWGYTDDANKVFQFTVRDDVTFSDGEKLNAEAVKAWIEYYQNSGGLFALVFQRITGVAVIDDYTVELTLNASDPFWPFYLSQNRMGFPISPAALSDPDALGTSTAGAGPYVLDAAASTPGTTYVYTARDDYWDPERIYWDKLEITVITDAGATLSALQSGQVDFAIGQARDAEAAASSGVTVTSAPLIWNALIIQDRAGQSIPALGEQKVRQALNWAVDRAAVSKAVFGELGAPNVSMVVDGFNSFTEDVEGSYGYDVDTAKQLLSEAGYADGFELPICTRNRNGAETTHLQAVAGYLEDAGIRVQIKEFTDGAAMITARRALECPTELFFGQISESNNLAVEQLVPEAGVLNSFQFSTPELLELLDTAQSAPADELVEAQQELQKYIVDFAFYANYGVSDLVVFTSSAVNAPDLTAAQPIPSVVRITPASK